MNFETMTAHEIKDAELVSRSLTGDRDSFNHIVVRYQNLICSLAYNAIGNLGQSEDVAQETFITAWIHLGDLREPSKLRAWLCGIVRNLIHKTLHREGREPVHSAETLDALEESAGAHALPSDEAISQEEQAILWRSLERIPSTYREPLILFYREHESVEAVARELDLSEDAVKQRLSRGRKLLQEEVQSFVEKTLRRSAPGSTFSCAVLAALPAAPVATIGTATIGKGAVAAKYGLLGAWLAPLLGVLGGLIAHWLVVRTAPTARERRVKIIGFSCLWGFALGWCVAGQLAVRELSRSRGWSDATFYAVMAGFWWIYAMAIVTVGVVSFRRAIAVREATESNLADIPSAARHFGLGTRIAMVAGVYLACFSWIVNVAWQAHDPVVAFLIGIVAIGLAIWHYNEIHKRSGADVIRGVARQMLITWGTILLIVNCRLETWMASVHGITLAEMSHLLSPWVAPLLTLAVIGWAALLVSITKPARLSQPNEL